MDSSLKWVIIIIALLGTGFVVVGVTYKVPYEDREPYEVQEPYQYTVDLTYNVISTSRYNCGSLFDYVLCVDISVENIDTEGGTFTVNCEFQTLDRILSDYDSGYIGPGATNTFTCSANIGISEDVNPSYTVTPGTKTITEYRTVTKYRTVTRYKTLFG